MALPLLSLAGKGLKALGKRRAAKKAAQAKTGKQVAEKITGKRQEGVTVDKTQNPPINFDSSVPSTDISDSSGVSKGTTPEQVALEIHSKTIKIRNLLKGSLVLDKMQEENRKKVIKKGKRTKAENELEKDNKGKFRLPIPGAQKVKSLWERIKNFFLTILWGKIALAFVDKTALIVKWLPTIAKGVDFVMNLGIGFIDLLGSAVLAAYDAYDWTRGSIIKVFGGRTLAEQEQFAQKFDDFMGVANQVMNLVIALGMAAAAIGNQRNKNRNRNRTPDDIKRNRTKKKNRRRRFRDPKYRRRVSDRLKKLNEAKRVASRRRFVNTWRKRIGLDSPQLDTKPGTRQLNLFEDIDTPTSRKPSILDELFDVDTKKVTPKGPSLRKRLSNLWEGGSGWRQKQATRVGQVKDFVVEGTRRNIERSRAWIDEIGDVVYRNTIGKIDEQLKKLDPGTVLKNISKGDGVLAKGAQRMLGFFDNPLTKRILNKVPFIGDAIVFLIDLLSGKHWVRALLRTIGAIGLDAGFYGLMGMTALGAPFTGGTSLVISAAVLAAYMAADAAAGAALGSEGVGQFMGDQMADQLGVPKMAGEEGSGPWQKLFGAGGAVSTSVGSIKKMIENIQLSPKQIEAINNVGGGLGNKNLLDDKSPIDKENGVDVKGTENKENGVDVKGTDGESLENKLKTANDQGGAEAVIDSISTTASYEEAVSDDVNVQEAYNNGFLDGSNSSQENKTNQEIGKKVDLLAINMGTEADPYENLYKGS